jgi:hypothetical protein
MSETPDTPTTPTTVATVAGIVFIVLSIFFAGFRIAHLGHHGCHHHGWHHHSMGQGGPHQHGQGAGFHEGFRGPGPSHMPESVTPSLAPANP